MSLAGGGSGSRAASPRPSAEMADGGEGEGRSQPPPDTISKTKVKWTWQHFDRTNVGAVRRSLTLDVHDANQVKDDDLTEETPMTEKEASARTEQAAHEGGLQEDLLWANDVRDEEQQRAVDQFLTDCVQVSEDVTLQVDPSLASIFAGRRHSAVDGGPEDRAAEPEANSSAAADPGASWGLPPLRGGAHPSTRRTVALR